MEDLRFELPQVGHLRESGPAVKILSIEPLPEDVGDTQFAALEWVIVRGESGPGARPIPAEWIRPPPQPLRRLR